MSEYKLQVGDRIPNFSLLDERGRPFNSDELYEAFSIIYFYPKDDTPGCTAEACSIQNALEILTDLRLKVIGISPDSVESHEAFRKKYSLEFTLLSDTDHQVAESFDVWKEKNIFGNKVMGIIRSTFLVDGEGIIRWIERPVEVEGHIERILRAIRAYSTQLPEE